jgi:CMD domain protein
MGAQHADLIDQLLSITAGSRLDQIRRHREIARDNVQKAYDALFAPRDTSAVSLLERFAIAGFVAGLHGQLGLTDHYTHRLTLLEGGPALAVIVGSETERGAVQGPYGDYPAGPLTPENKPGLHYAVAPDSRQFLGAKLSAAFEHAHLLVFRPRDASRQALQTLLDAGWSNDGIVTLSQLVAYLAFQVRLVEGLTALAASASQTTTEATFSQALAAGANS